MTITAPGYYRLTKNIVSSAMTGNIITIQQHNVTIDFNSFFIIGPTNTANTVVGVSANEFGNITIKNGTIAFCQVGIQFNGNGSTTTANVNQSVENMRFSKCWSYGIYIPASSPGTVLSNCLFSQIGGSTAGTLPGGCAILGSFSDQTIQVKDNIINNVTGDSGSPTNSYGILYAFAVRNSIAIAHTGIYGGKYQNNLTSGCTVPFTGGTDAGGNN
jgi:hypothetical protein